MNTLLNVRITTAETWEVLEGTDWKLNVAFLILTLISHRFFL